MESQAEQLGAFLDYEISTAVEGFAVVKCIAVSSDGVKRRVRIATADNVYLAQERSGIMALSKLFDRQELPKEATAIFDDKQKGSHVIPVSDNNKKSGQTTGGTHAGSGAGSATQKKPATNSNKTTGASTASMRENDDFRVNLSTYANREDNYITDLLKNDTGRQFLKTCCSIPNPPLNFQETLTRVKEYLTKHKIEL